MIGIEDAFSPTYAVARRKFLEGCMAAGLAAQAHVHPQRGAQGEALALDAALDGPPGADKLLIVSSACHGVEGHCGSGVQVFALHDAEWRDKARAAGVAVLYLHALNPHGFSHSRRVTHENVDLNRNFIDFSQPLPGNAPYAEVHPLLIPKEWPPTAQNQADISAWIERNGQAAFQTAVTAGQYQFEDGLFFGGKAPTWSQQALRAVLRQHARQARAIAWIDIHTGLGPSGHGERIFACRDDDAAYARANAWWGSPQTPVTSIYTGSSTSAKLNGMIGNVIYEECPQAEFTSIAMEYGTLPLMDVLTALRGNHWLHQHPEAPAAQAEAIRARTREAFYTDTEVWKAQVISQARQAMFQAVNGLG